VIRPLAVAPAFFTRTGAQCSVGPVSDGAVKTKTGPVELSMGPDVVRVATNLLREADLPSSDLVGSSGRFWGMHDGIQLVGLAGLEIYEPFGLLRSVAVSTRLRGRGMGERLVHAVTEFADEKGLRALYLLTSDADSFFERLGFRRLPRSNAPALIQESFQFSVLCPESAILMTKPLTVIDAHRQRGSS